MMMMMCKRLAQVPMLCVPIYNMKLAMMQKTPIFTTFSAHTKMAADKRGQDEVFGRIVTVRKYRTYCYLLLLVFIQCLWISTGKHWRSIVMHNLNGHLGMPTI